MKHFVRIACAASVALAGLPAFAQESSRPSFWEFITVENLAQALGHTVMGWARLLADIKYDQLAVDPVARRMTITGLTISPFLDSFPDGTCRISAKQATVNGVSVDRISHGQTRMALNDVEMSSGCLPLDAANTLRGLGFPVLQAGWAEIDLTYDYPSGAVDIRIDADLDRLASVSFAADLEYFSYRMNFKTEEPVIAADLSAAELTLQDRGGWDIAQRFLPPDLSSPEGAGQAVGLGLEQVLSEGNGPGTSLSPAQGEFVVQAARVAERFVRGDRRVVISTNIENTPVRLNEASGDDPRALFEALAPSVSTTAPAVSSAINIAALQAAINSETLPANAYELGRALATGIGAPKNEGHALRLLAPLARDGNRDASLLIARLIGETRPADAYPHALLANAAGLSGALALTDSVERRLSYQQATDTQNTLTSSPDETLYGDIGAMRTAAREYLIGVNRPRSWRAAYYWASMAAAAGDRGGAALRDEIDEMLRLRGDATAWRDDAEKLDNGVLRDWIAKDVPSRLR